MHTLHTDSLNRETRYAQVNGMVASALARGATGSGTWLNGCETGRAAIRPAIARVQGLSGRRPDELAGPAGISRPRPARGPSGNARYPSRTPEAGP